MLFRSTVELDRELATFRSSYQRYEESITKTLEIDCQERPVDFYQAIESARMYRAEVRQTVTKMSDLTKKYRAQIDAIRQSGAKKQGGVK